MIVTDYKYPLRENAELVNPDAIKSFVDMLYGVYECEGFATMLRGLGEKSTPQEARLKENIVLLPGQPYLEDGVDACAKRWACWHGGAFIVPALLDRELIEGGDGKPHAREEAVRGFTNVCLDLDKGDTEAALEYLTRYLPMPTMLVASGGTTEAKTPKLHIYWALTEAMWTPADMGVVREALAQRVGGDAVAFKKITQVIRIPGSVHAKGGHAKPVRILHYTADRRHDWSELRERIMEMPFMPGITPPAPQLPTLSPTFKAGELAFSGQTGNLAVTTDTARALSEPIREGGDDDRNRWSEFNKVAGHYIRESRNGLMDIATAKELTHAWMLAKMIPPWEPARFESEWHGLLSKDQRTHPAIPPAAPARAIVFTPNGDMIPAETPVNPLLSWAAYRWTVGRDKPRRRWAVNGLIAAGKPHLVVADGGAGKTFEMLRLAMLMTGTVAGDWWGQKVNQDECGTVVFITAEDDQEELHIRLKDLFSEQQVAAAADRLIILPLLNVGGTFPFVSTRRVTRNTAFGPVSIEEHAPSEKWQALLECLRSLPDLKLVIVDTLNATMHGEENNATVVQEYFRHATSPICGDMGAAFVVTHHVRKRGKEPVRTVEDMKDAIRGSSALPAAVRMVLGMWEALDWEARLEGMGEKPRPKTLYHAAVLKANNPEAVHEVKTLLRTASGGMEDVTKRDVLRITGDRRQELKAWLVAAAARAVKDGHPLMASSPTHGLGARRSELPPALSVMGEKALEKLAGDLVKKGALVRAEIPKSGKRGKVWLDVPGGPAAKPAPGRELLVQEGAYLPDWGGWHYDPAALAVFPPKR